jgi:hypothetical protein
MTDFLNPVLSFQRVSLWKHKYALSDAGYIDGRTGADAQRANRGPQSNTASIDDGGVALYSSQKVASIFAGSDGARRGGGEDQARPEHKPAGLFVVSAGKSIRGPRSVAGHLSAHRGYAVPSQNGSLIPNREYENFLISLQGIVFAFLLLLTFVRRTSRDMVTRVLDYLYARENFEPSPYYRGRYLVAICTFKNAALKGLSMPYEVAEVLFRDSRYAAKIEAWLDQRREYWRNWTVNPDGSVGAQLPLRKPVVSSLTQSGRWIMAAAAAKKAVAA